MIIVVSNPRSRAASHPAIRTTLEWKKQDRTLFSWRHVFKWIGLLSTGLLVAAAFVPHPFGVPADLQPWVFVTAIFWFLAFCAGMFET